MDQTSWLSVATAGIHAIRKVPNVKVNLQIQRKIGDLNGEEVRNNLLFLQVFCRRLILVAARSKGWFCARSLAGIAGSNPAAGWISYCVACQAERSLCRADHSCRGVLQSVVCLSVIVKHR